MNTALLVVSFGTTHLPAFRQAIEPTEQALRDAFPGLPFYRAFTSSAVRARLSQPVDDVAQALERIRNDGYGQVLIQPTLVIPGGEWHRLLEQIRLFRQDLTVAIGMPLLACEKDLDRLTPILLQTYPQPVDSGLLLMAHGTDGSGSELYEALSRKLRMHAIGLCSVGGMPSFADGIAQLRSFGVGRVQLAPLLFLPGVHARKDMAGTGPESLRSLLEAEGFTVTPVLRGLGELPAVREMYVDHAKAAYSELSNNKTQ